MMESSNPAVALVHAHGSNLDTEIWPDDIGRLRTAAAGIMYRQEQLIDIAFTGDRHSPKRVWSMAFEQRADLKRLFPEIPRQRIHVEETARTTLQELKTFKTLAHNNSWQNLVCISDHYQKRAVETRIERVFPDNQRPTHVSLEDIFYLADGSINTRVFAYINRNHVATVRSMVESWRNSRATLSLARYEKVRGLIDQMPGGTTVLEWVTPLFGDSKIAIALAIADRFGGKKNNG